MTLFENNNMEITADYNSRWGYYDVRINGEDFICIKVEDIDYFKDGLMTLIDKYMI